MKLVIIIFLIISIISCHSWQVPASSRGKIKSFAAAIVFSQGLGNALESNSFDLSPVVQQVKAAESVFVGSYNDPNHPGCLRKITVKGKEVTILGSDSIDGSNQWLLKANEGYPGTIFVDFSPKGGPSDLLGVYNDKADGIKWPDGNMWAKLKVKSK